MESVQKIYIHYRYKRRLIEVVYRICTKNYIQYSIEL